jgi:hypothetical protein
MSSIISQPWISKVSATGRLLSGFWLLAMLLVLHGTIQPVHFSNPQEFSHKAGPASGMGASERTQSPSLHHRATPGTVVVEGRSIASWRDLPLDGETSSAILPLPAALDTPTPVPPVWGSFASNLAKNSGTHSRHAPLRSPHDLPPHMSGGHSGYALRHIARFRPHWRSAPGSEHNSCERPLGCSRPMPPSSCSVS